MSEYQYDLGTLPKFSLKNPELSYFINSVKYEDIFKPLRSYMLYNNYRMEEIHHVFNILNEFCRVRKREIEEGLKIQKGNNGQE